MEIADAAPAASVTFCSSPSTKVFGEPWDVTWYQRSLLRPSPAGEP
jgi:hypothetical protein